MTINFLARPNGQKIAYRQRLAPPKINNNKCGVLFLNGFRSSSMKGNKVSRLEEFCYSCLKIDFTSFDYQGHGESCSGNHDFERLCLTDWIEDSKAILENCCQGSQTTILVGSSMGAWIALHLALEQPQKVSGILGIAAAPDFTVDLWNGLSLAQREELQNNNRVLISSEYSRDPYPISQYLLDDANQWLLLEDSPASTQSAKPLNKLAIDIHCPVRLIHGQKDLDVSWKKSLQLVDSIAANDVHLTLIKSGDHRLSTPKNLDAICQVLEDLVDTVS